MYIKTAVTDANIFIDLYALDLIHRFFLLKLEVYTTFLVFNELNENQQDCLNQFVAKKRLQISVFNADDMINLSADGYPNALSIADRSVLYLANQLGACVLSSDKALRKLAHNKTNAYHGMLWIFDRMIEFNILTTEQATQKLQQLLFQNSLFRNNPSLQKEIDTRLFRWRNEV